MLTPDILCIQNTLVKGRNFLMAANNMRRLLDGIDTGIFKEERR